MTKDAKLRAQHMSEIKPFHFARCTVVIGTYNYGVHLWGENMSRKQAARMVKEMEGERVSSHWLGLTQDIRLESWYVITRMYLHGVSPDGTCGVIVAECEAVQSPLGEAGTF